jgi:hypothetical protein
MNFQTVFDSGPWSTDSHLQSPGITDHDNPGYNRVTNLSSSVVGKQRSASNVKSFALSASTPTERVSLADQYLDTMIMNDVWRSICLSIILQSQQERRKFKRPNATSTKRHHKPSAAIHDYTAVPSKPQSIGRTKSKIPSATSLTASNKSCIGKPASLDDSDSEFGSNVRTPHSEIYGPARSTRSQSTMGFSTTISFDSRSSLAGRRCLSCKSTSTTCWRHAFGGVVCNSCGLR